VIRPSRRVLEAVAVCGLLAAAGVLFSRNIDTAPSYDEGVYLASLDALRHGQTLGSQVFASQPPGFYIVLRLIGLPFGSSISGIRTGFLLVALGGCLAAYLLGRRLSGPAAGFAAAALIAVAPPFPSEAPRVEADVPSVALALAALAVAAYAFGRGRTFLAALAGGLLAAAVSVKFLALPAVVPFAALAFAQRAARRQVVAAALGALVVVAVLLALYAGVLGELWDQAVRFHNRARSFQGPYDNADRLADFFDLRTPFPWLVAFGLAASVASRRVWPFWLFPAAAVAFLLWERPLFDHHLVLLSAALALPASLALGAFVTRLPHRLALAAAGALVAALALGLGQQVRRIDYARVTTTQDVEWGVTALARCTSPGELVASDQPIVAFRAHRRLPGQLVDTSLVRVETNSLTPARILELVGRDHIRAVFAGRAFADEPDLVAGLRSRFPRRLRHGEVTLYLSGSSCP
jgi:4-amino-4-deoxy-L-arabinose transferase-like glycosyltransferase